jgi:hypothetical protein
VKAADDETGSPCVRQCEREALVAARVLERIESDQPHALNRSTADRLLDRGPSGQLVELADDRVQLVEMRVQDGIEVPALGAPGQRIEPAAEAPKLSQLEDAEKNEAEDGDTEADDDRAENRLDEGVQIDRSILQAGGTEKAGASASGPSLAGGQSRPIRSALPRMLSSARPNVPDSESLTGMAKRSRVAARPGQRRPLQRTAPRTESARPARPDGSVTPEEEARAAELERAILAEEKAATDARRSREQATRPAAAIAARVNYTSVPLATRAAAEYGYVRRDIRRISIVGGSLLLVLAILEVLVNVLHLFAI